MTLQGFCLSLLEVGRRSFKYDRVILPWLEVVDCLFTAGLLNQVGTVTFYDDLFDIAKKEVFKIKDVRKLSAAMKVFSGLLFLSGDDVFTKSAHSKSMRQIVNYLVHPYPKVCHLSFF